MLMWGLTGTAQVDLSRYGRADAGRQTARADGSRPFGRRRERGFCNVQRQELFETRERCRRILRIVLGCSPNVHDSEGNR